MTQLDASTQPADSQARPEPQAGDFSGMSVGMSSSKLLWLFASMIIASVVVFAFGFYRQFESASLVTLERELGNLSAVVADDLADDIRSAATALNITAEALATAPPPRPGSPQAAARSQLLQAGLRTRQIQALLWLDPQGKVIGTTHEHGAASDDFSAHDYFQAHVDRSRPATLFVGEPGAGRAPGELLLSVSYPILDAQGTFLGVLAASLGLDQQLGINQTLNLGEGGRVSVFSRTGQLVAAFPVDAPTSNRNFANHPTLERAFAATAPLFMRAPAVTSGRDAFLIARRIPDTPLVLLVARDAVEARNALLRQRDYIAAVTLAISIAILLFTGMFSRQLVQREQIEADLAESRKSLLAAQRVARLGSWTVDLAKGSITLSEQANSILELPEGTKFANPQAVVSQIVHPDDRAEVAATVKRVLGGEVVESEHRILTPSGRVKWLRTRTEAGAGPAGPEHIHGTIQDVTQIKEAQLRLAESERGYRVLSDNMRDLVSLHELNGTLRFASHSFKRIAGYSPVDLVGRSFFNWVHPDDATALRIELDRQIKLGKVDLSTEFRFRHQAGHYIWLECLAAAVHDEQHNLLYVQASSRDVTERRRALSALRDSETRFRRIIEFTSDLYWETDSEYRFTQLSVGSQKYMGVVSQSVGVRRWDSPFNQAPKAVWDQHKADIAARRPFKDLLLNLVDPKTGQILEYSSISGEPFYDDEGRFRGYRGIGRFITQQKRYELDLAERTRQLSEVNAELNREAGRRRELERRLLLAIEKELAQVGLELHDELGQNLTGTAFLAKTLQKKLAEKGIPEAVDAARVHALVNETIRQTRLISHGLSPHIMGPEGLVEALQQLADDVNSLGIIECRFECDGDPQITDNLVARGLYRIAQEAVNNALKHSQAKNIMIELTALGGETRVAVIDNGIGIRAHDKEPLSDSALHSIKYRAGVLGASLSVMRRPDGGTEIAVALPVDTDAVLPSNSRENA